MTNQLKPFIQSLKKSEPGIRVHGTTSVTRKSFWRGGVVDSRIESVTFDTTYGDLTVWADGDVRMAK
jgi:hypothetical protein